MERTYDVNLDLNITPLSRPRPVNTTLTPTLWFEYIVMCRDNCHNSFYTLPFLVICYLLLRGLTVLLGPSRGSRVKAYEIPNICLLNTIHRSGCFISMAIHPGSYSIDRVSSGLSYWLTLLSSLPFKAVLPLVSRCLAFGHSLSTKNIWSTCYYSRLASSCFSTCARADQTWDTVCQMPDARCYAMSSPSLAWSPPFKEPPNFFVTIRPSLPKWYILRGFFFLPFLPCPPVTFFKVYEGGISVFVIYMVRMEGTADLSLKSPVSCACQPHISRSR